MAPLLRPLAVNRMTGFFSTVAASFAAGVLTAGVVAGVKYAFVAINKSPRHAKPRGGKHHRR
jgi:hypothetical protein